MLASSIVVRNAAVGAFAFVERFVGHHFVFHLLACTQWSVDVLLELVGLGLDSFCLLNVCGILE